jgi:RNA polymerase sigma-70 factor (ECF subfamily)
VGVRAATMDLERLSDEELVSHARAAGAGETADAALDILYRRFHPRVAAWCLRFCGNRQDAADLAQEVFVRVHERLDSFRGDSRFSTWLYTVARRVAINRAEASRLRRTESLDAVASEPVDPAPDAEDEASRAEVVAAFRQAMREDLEPLEARVLYLHYVEGMTLPAISALLQLPNRSGAKAYVVGGRRKLERKFGRWLRREGGPS